MPDTATFKDVSFFYETITDNFGRRGEQHEFIYRDEPWFEDLGRKAIEIEATGEWCREDDIEALREAIRVGGAGTFSHPRWGDLEAIAYEAEFSVNERYPDSGRYTIRFHEAGEYRFPTPGSANLLGSVAQAAIDGLPQLTGGGNFETFGEIGLGASSLVWLADEGILLSEYARPAFRVLQGMQSFPETFRGRPDATQLIHAVIEAISLGYDDARNALEFLFTNYRTFSTATPPFPVNQFTQASYDQERAFDSLVRKAALIEAARLIQEVEFVSTVDAIGIRDEILAWFDEELARGDCGCFEEILALKFEVMKTIGSRLAVLPTVVRFCFSESLPAVVIAHRIACDYTRWEDVKNQNPSMHPLFMPREIEFLT